MVPEIQATEIEEEKSGVAIHPQAHPVGAEGVLPPGPPSEEGVGENSAPTQGGDSGDAVGEKRKYRKKKILPIDAFRVVVVEAGGNIIRIAQATDSTTSNVVQRIRGDPELNAIYGDHKNRRNNSLAHQITQRDLETYREALKLYGVSDKHLKKLAALDGLASDDALLAVAIKVCIQSYLGMLHDLDELAASAKERRMGTKVEDGTSCGTLIDLNTEDFCEVSKIQIECAKERGKGFALMMNALEAVERMTKKDDNKEDGKVAPGWGKMKKVRPALANGTEEPEQP